MSFHPYTPVKTLPGSLSVADWGGVEQRADRQRPFADTPSVRDIGVSVGERTRELFVSGPVEAALSSQLDLSGLRYMALGDLGGGLARRCLIDTARASGWPIQRLIVRRQGLGETVATVLFLDSPAQDGQMVRVVCADVDADDASRRALFLLWMARSELAALMVPEQDVLLQAQAIDALREQVAQAQPAWRSRKLIFMPKQTSPDLIQHIAAFQHATGIESRLAPAVRRADRAWVFLGSAWNQLQDAAPAGHARRLSTLALAPLPEDAVGLPRHESEVVPPADVPALRYVKHLLAQPGVIRACLFDLQTLAIRAHSGDAEEAQAMARQGRQLLSCGGRAGEEMALGQSIAEINLTFWQHRVVLRGVAALPGCVMHAILDRKAPPLGTLPSLAQLMGVAQPA